MFLLGQFALLQSVASHPTLKSAGTPPEKPVSAAPQTTQSPNLSAGEVAHQLAILHSLDAQADSCAEQHDFPDSKQYHEQALKFASTVFGPDSLITGNEWFSMGWFWADMADYVKAETAFQKTYDIRLKILGQNSLGIAEVFNAQAVVAENESQPTKAEALYKVAISIQEQDAGPNSLMLANMLNNLATLYWIFGDYQRAEDNLDRALTIREERLGPQSLSVADTLNNVALVDLTLGNTREAKNYFEKALTIRKSRLGEKSPFTASTMSQLGRLYSRLGDTSAAELLLEHAAASRLSFYGTQHPEVAQSLFDLAVLYDQEGRYDKAEPDYLNALQIQKSLGEDTPDYAEILAYLGLHDHLQGKFSSALSHYQEALAIQQKILVPNHPETVKTATWLAKLQLDLGNSEEAETMAKLVVASRLATINGVFHFAPEDQRLGFEDQRLGFDHPGGLCDLPATLGDAALIAETVLRTKGIVLDSILEDRALAQKNGLNPTTLAPDAAVLAKAQPVSAANPTQNRTEVDELVTERIQRVAWVERVSQGEKVRRSIQVTVNEVQENLPEHAALLEYVSFNRYIGKLQTEPSLGVVVIAKNCAPIWVPLGDQASLSPIIRDYQHFVRKRVHETVLAAVLQNLHKRLIEPVLSRLPGDINRFIISPDGELNFLSFATFLDDQNHFLAQDYALEYVASGRDLLRNDAASIGPPAVTDKPASPVAKMVILANPDYGRDNGSDTSQAYFEPLPGTAEEAQFLANEANRRGWTVNVLDGDRATKENLSQVDSPYILHIASHALFLGPDAVAAWHLATDADADASDEGRGVGQGFLALSGANLTIKNWETETPHGSRMNDGMLSGEEVGALRLQGTWLVTLSACDTGCGEALAGEGVLGLRRGFTEAGAENLLLTLWPISDSETADLMKVFYQQALTSHNAPAALAQVQRDALVTLRQKEGLTAAVWKAGPFILSY